MSKCSKLKFITFANIHCIFTCFLSSKKEESQEHSTTEVQSTKWEHVTYQPITNITFYHLSRNSPPAQPSRPHWPVYGPIWPPIQACYSATTTLPSCNRNTVLVIWRRYKDNLCSWSKSIVISTRACLGITMVKSCLNLLWKKWRRSEVYKFYHFSVGTSLIQYSV